MSKSILVIETPQNYSKCPLFFEAYTDMTCNANNETIDYLYPDNKVQDWCPLKQLPPKYPEKNYTPIETKQYMEGYEDGYNSCLNYIDRT